MNRAPRIPGPSTPSPQSQDGCRLPLLTVFVGAHQQRIPFRLCPPRARGGALLDPGWELVDRDGVVVTRMAARFQPPTGEIVAVRVGAVLVREAGDEVGLRCQRWELVLPEIEYEPEPSSVSSSHIQA